MENEVTGHGTTASDVDEFPETTGDHDSGKKPQTKRKRKGSGKDYQENDNSEESDNSEENHGMLC